MFRLAQHNRAFPYIECSIERGMIIHPVACPNDVRLNNG